MTYSEPEVQPLLLALAAIQHQSVYNKMGPYMDRLDLVEQTGVCCSDVADPATYEADE